jgi:hypothetical protein
MQLFLMIINYKGVSLKKNAIKVNFALYPHQYKGIIEKVLIVAGSKY